MKTLVFLACLTALGCGIEKPGELPPAAFECQVVPSASMDCYETDADGRIVAVCVDAAGAVMGECQSAPDVDPRLHCVATCPPVGP